MNDTIEADNEGIPTKESVARLSGNAYVSARLRSWAGSNSERRPRIPIVAVNNCQHGYTICASRECVESWSCDWNLFLQRTGGGRRLIEELELTEVEVAALCDDSNRSITERSIRI